MKFMYSLILFLTISISIYGQSDIMTQYYKADSLVRAENFIESYPILKDLLPKTSKKDNLYSNVLWHLITTTTKLESSNRMNEKWENALKYGLEALKYIKLGNSFFDKSKLKNEEFWMYKNLVVSYFGSGQLDNAKKYMNILYKSYKKNELPDYYQIDKYFNFSFFKWNGHNIWGYEWYSELPKDRFSSSFTKIVYYVYSTNPDGSDKDQIYRYHVLMFHQNSKNAKFDYLLERQIETESATICGSYYNYVYNEEIDYVKLKKDILEILENNIQPDSKRITPKR